MDIWMHLRLRVRNPNFVSVDYEPAVTSIAYRGRLLGFATSGKTSVDSRGVSYVEATLRFNEIRVMQDVVYYFNDDLEKGILPLDTTTEIDGTVQILLLSVPVKGKISCSIHVNMKNQTVVHEDCYPVISFDRS